MDLGMGQSADLQMQQKLSPRMIQSLKLLQVNNIQLEQQIAEELSQNPFLERMDTESDEGEELPEQEEADFDENLDFSEDEATGSTLEDGFEYSYDLGGDSGSDEDYLKKREYARSLQTYTDTLETHLTAQIREKKLSERQRLLAEFLIGSLDTAGYLKIPEEEICSITGVTPDEAEEGIARIQSLEPAGVGARSLQECLLLQLERRDRATPLARQIIRDYWDEFEKMKIPAIARGLDVAQNIVSEAMEEIRLLDPKPGSEFADGGSAEHTICPDLVVIYEDHRWISIINDRFLPDLAINRSYSDRIRDRDDKEVKRFLQEKFNSAEWLIEAVEQRKRTMLRVMDTIIDIQKDFFENGDENQLRPMTLQQIADRTDLNASTVSRVTNGKYVETPYGLFELKYFFSSSVGTDSSGRDVSSTKIRNIIKDLVEKEDQRTPLSDQKLSAALKDAGFSVARRTVAKYRDQLGIPTARMRKSYE
ncbi:MAG: RNA polymerase factor sigma-54 [Fibrobacterota bacterium]